MLLQIDVKNCKECPYSWPGDMKMSHKSYVCDRLSDNIGAGDVVSERCPFREEPDECAGKTE